MTPLAFVSPMMAMRADVPPPPGAWRYEVKLDGYRAIALLGATSTRLLSRTQQDFATQFPELVTALEAFPVRDTILDGEVVALDDAGRSSFERLHDGTGPRVYYVFDVLRVQGQDVTKRPLHERKAILQVLFGAALPHVIRFCDSISGDLEPLLAAASELGLEGLIGKRPDSIYEPGLRSGAWIKLKFVEQQELVIGGYTDPEGGRAHFGALVVGYYEKGRFLYAGCVGSGLTDSSLRVLASNLAPLARETCPFDNLPEAPSRGRGARMTRSEMKRCHWVEPKLVCQVRFADWSRDGHLRHPVYLGLRDDVEPLRVQRERVV